MMVINVSNHRILYEGVGDADDAPMAISNSEPSDVPEVLTAKQIEEPNRARARAARARKEATYHGSAQIK